VRSNIDPSDASNLAISKYGGTNAESIFSKDGSLKHKKINRVGQNNLYRNKFNAKNVYQQSRYTKTDAT